MKKIIIATTLAIGCASAFAVTAQSGIYVGGLGGWSFADSPTTGQMVATSKDNHNYTLGGTVGYNYAINQNWLTGFEVSYLNFGETKYNASYGNTNLKNYGVQLMATGTYLMANGFNVFAKAGAIDQTMTSSNNMYALNSNNGNTKITKWLPAAAAGVGYMPTQNLNIALQYERTFGTNWDNNNLSATPKPMTQNAVTLGVTYTFPL
jgi:opacity protein-like surface antigen